MSNVYEEVTCSAEPTPVPLSGKSPGKSTKSSHDITWSDVCFKIGEKDILKNSWGKARAREITGLLGPSGSGKTSLLNLLSGRVRKYVLHMYL